MKVATGGITYPLAEVELKSISWKWQWQVPPVLLGNDIPLVKHILKRIQPEEQPHQTKSGTMFVVTTRRESGS